MRKGFDGLALLVQETLRRNPHNGHLFVLTPRILLTHSLARIRQLRVFLAAPVSVSCW
jgi:hypothetical protein